MTSRYLPVRPLVLLSCAAQHQQAVVLVQDKHEATVVDLFVLDENPTALSYADVVLVITSCCLLETASFLHCDFFEM